MDELQAWRRELGHYLDAEDGTPYPNYARWMRRVTGIAAALLFLLPSVPTAATPASPPSGTAFTTTDMTAFRAAAEPDEPAYWFFFSAGTAFDAERYFSVPGDGDGNSVRMDLGFLATKFDHFELRARPAPISHHLSPKRIVYTRETPRASQ